MKCFRRFETFQTALTARMGGPGQDWAAAEGAAAARRRAAGTLPEALHQLPVQVVACQPAMISTVFSRSCRVSYCITPDPRRKQGAPGAA